MINYAHYHIRPSLVKAVKRRLKEDGKDMEMVGFYTVELKQIRADFFPMIIVRDMKLKEIASYRLNDFLAEPKGLIKAMLEKWSGSSNKHSS